MTIKEIEYLSKMTRANIRFYESQGLINPIRNQNGYRDYSYNDLKILKRIKLLRAIHITLEEIKQLHNEKQDIIVTLNEHIEKLGIEKKDIVLCQQICTSMKNDGVNYKTFDAQNYLNTLERNNDINIQNIDGDEIKNVVAPWRRFFARTLDFALYSTIYQFIAANLMNVNFSNGDLLLSIVNVVVVCAVIIIIEPILLCLTGTTFGKWILGIKVLDFEDNYLTYDAALTRTFLVMKWGEGIFIPVYNLYRNYKSYQSYKLGNSLDWENDSILVIKDKSKWFILSYTMGYTLVIVISLIGVKLATMPKNINDITVSNFSENYNIFQKYYLSDTTMCLSETGEWIEDVGYGYVYEVNKLDEPQFIFTQENGLMTGMNFSQTVNNSIFVPPYQDEMILAIKSFVQAKENFTLLSTDVDKIIENIKQNPHENFEYTVNGIKITCDINFSGYIDYRNDQGILFPDSTKNQEYNLTFSMNMK